MEFINLGFAEKSDNWTLHPKFFPSKIGGKPAWLNPVGIPKTCEMECGKCKDPLIFLCQVYAPTEVSDSCFHRTIFIFICRNNKCCTLNSSENFLVLRCQLPKINDHYPAEPASYEDGGEFDMSKWPNLCKICGCLGSSRCTKCKKVNYCTRKHQMLDWQKDHRERCGSETITNLNYNFSIPDSAKNLLFTEYELEIAEEGEEVKPEIKEEEELEKMKQILKKQARGLVNANEAELEQYTTSKVVDKFFQKFKKRVARDPEQVLRYQIGAEPLWITDKCVPSTTNIPNCEYCNGERQFEFQIMPQLLNLLNVGSEVDSIDWGILCVFTCKNCCDEGPVYKKEYIIKQDLIDSPFD